jgi:hypothetical protein
MEATANVGIDVEREDAWFERRWREDVRLRALARRAPEPFRVPVWGWIGIAAAVLAIVLRIALQPQRITPADNSSMHIVLLDAPAPEPPLPQPAPLPARTAQIARRIAPPSPASAPPAPVAEPEESAPLRLFNADGSVVLPREPQRVDSMTAMFAAPRLPESIAIMRHQRPLKVRPNHFAQNFRQPGGSALTDFVADHLTAKKEFTLPWGTHVECVGVSLFVAFVGGCGWYTPYRYYVPIERWKPATELDEQ